MLIVVVRWLYFQKGTLQSPLFVLIYPNIKIILFDVNENDIDKRMAVLEEKMKTHETRLESTLNALRTDIERGKNDQIKWIVGVVAVAVIIIIGVLG